MNPGPWGMAQTGVPFGQIAAARDWLELDGENTQPKREHRLRPIEGWACKRSEVSGERLWGLFKARFTTPARFFEKHFVCNYCPLCFHGKSARNVTPDKLPAAARGPLESICDQHLRELIGVLAPNGSLGWAHGQKAAPSVWLLRICASARSSIPVPAPAANRDWAGTATSQLQELGVW